MHIYIYIYIWLIAVEQTLIVMFGCCETKEKVPSLSLYIYTYMCIFIHTCNTNIDRDTWPLMGNGKLLYTYMYIYIYIQFMYFHMVLACFGVSSIHMVSKSACLKYSYGLIIVCSLTYSIGLKKRLSQVFIWIQRISAGLACFYMF
jgi:hypothetical protein